jgi:signal transduction histidine kinase/CheY-like chemotaxis protein
MAINYNRIGVIYHLMGIYDKALDFLLKSLKISKDSDNKLRMAQVYNNLGLVYKDMDQIDQAFETFQNALAISNQLNDKMLKAYTLNNIGIIYKILKEYDKALDFYHQSLDLKIEAGENRSITNSLGNIGEVYMIKKDYNKALEYFNKVSELTEKSGDTYSLCVNHLNYGKIFMYQKNFSKSEDRLRQSLDLAIKNQFNDLRKEIYYTISELYENMNNPALAIRYYKYYAELKDSLFNEQKNRLMVQTIATYQLDQTQKENEILRYKSNLDDQKIKSSRTFQILLVLLLMALAVITILIHIRMKENNKRRRYFTEKNKEIEKVNEELSALNNELEKNVKERTRELSLQINDKQEALLKMENALNEAEKANHLKDAFLSNINHEIRTPLSAIMGLTEVLRTKITHPEIISYLEGIHQSSNRLHSLLNNIIDFSRLQTNDLTLNLSSCDPNSIVSNAIELFRFKANEKHINIDLFLGNVPKVFADVNFLSKVVSDIIDNAVKYTNKGSIEIHTSFIIQQNEVQIKVSDTGIGIEESYLPHIFETFRQESTGYARLYEGAGLGLPLARRLINMMNGRLEVSSRKGKGTTVTLFLPAEKTAGTDSQSITYDSVQISDNNFDAVMNKALIIEDDPFNALFISAIIEGLSQVTIAENGDQALQMIKDLTESENACYNVVLIDINLPGAWDGVSLMKKIKEDFPRYQGVPFIAQTAYSINTEQFHLTDAGFNETIVKPIESVKLKNIVKKYLFRQ